MGFKKETRKTTTNGKETTIIATENDVGEVDETERYYTITVRYDVSGDACDPPPHITDRMMKAMSILHTEGFGMDVNYGFTSNTEYQKFIAGMVWVYLPSYDE